MDGQQDRLKNSYFFKLQNMDLFDLLNYMWGGWSGLCDYKIHSGSNSVYFRLTFDNNWQIKTIMKISPVWQN